MKGPIKRWLCVSRILVAIHTAHKPYAEKEVKLLLIEPSGVTNTGDQGGERTVSNDIWI